MEDPNLKIIAFSKERSLLAAEVSNHQLMEMQFVEVMCSEQSLYMAPQASS
jgi:hypothetical protein